MTCISGVIYKNKVYIGADSAATDSDGFQSLTRNPKVFKKKGFIIGCTSSFRMIQLIKYSLDIPEYSGGDVHEYMCTLFVDALRDCFKKGGWLTNENGVEEGGQFIIGFKGRLFEIFSDFQVHEPIEPYASCGSGSELALGSLFSTKGLPKQRILKSLQAAEKYNSAVCSPFVIEKI